MLEEIEEEYISIFIVVVIMTVSLILLWYILPFQLQKTEQQKHVRFSDEDDFFSRLKEWKNRVIHFVKNIFFNSRVENGILKSTRYTSDSKYAELFDSRLSK